MPNLNPKGAGDNFYPQFNEITTEPASAITIIKGRLYTKGSGAATANNLVAAGATGFVNGIYQAAVGIETAGTAGQHSVQCFGPGSRIGLAAKTANLHAGQKVKYDTTNHNVELWTTGAADAQLFVGRIFAIYSRASATVKKGVSAVGDILIIELGRGA